MPDIAIGRGMHPRSAHFALNFPRPPPLPTQTATSVVPLFLIRERNQEQGAKVRLGRQVDGVWTYVEGLGVATPKMGLNWLFPNSQVNGGILIAALIIEIIVKTST